MIEAKTLQKYPFAENLSQQEIHVLAALFLHKTYKAGEIIIEENSLGHELFLVQKGVVDIIKTERKRKHHFHEIGEGDVFGELSFFDKLGRSASVKARGDVEVYSLKMDDLEKLPEDFAYLKYKFPLQIAHVTVQRLRSTNQERFQEVNLRNRFANFVLLLVIGFSLTTCFAGFFKDMANMLPTYWVSAAAVLVTTVLSFVAAKILGQPLSFFGLTLQNWKRSLAEGIVISALLVLVFILIWSPEELWATLEPLFMESYIGIIYIPVVMLQGFIFWGVLQTSLQGFYQDDRGYAALFITSLGFAVSHVHFGVVTTISAFFMACFLVTIYIRHKNLLGVSIVHYILGCLGTVLGLI